MMGISARPRVRRWNPSVWRTLRRACTSTFGAIGALLSKPRTRSQTDLASQMEPPQGRGGPQARAKDSAPSRAAFFASATVDRMGSARTCFCNPRQRGKPAHHASGSPQSARDGRPTGQTAAAAAGERRRGRGHLTAAQCDESAAVVLPGRAGGHAGEPRRCRWRRRLASLPLLRVPHHRRWPCPRPSTVFRDEQEAAAAGRERRQARRCRLATRLRTHRLDFRRFSVAVARARADGGCATPLQPRPPTAQRLVGDPGDAAHIPLLGTRGPVQFPGLPAPGSALWAALVGSGDCRPAVVWRAARQEGMMRCLRPHTWAVATCMYVPRERNADGTWWQSPLGCVGEILL